MKKWILILFVLLVAVPASAQTKVGASVNDWTAVAQDAVFEGATTDISGMYQATYHISVALTTTTLHNGTKIDVQTSSNTSGDEDWITYRSFTSITGTAATEALGTEAAAQTVLEVSSTTGFEADETRWIFILDNTVADSEMVYQVSHATNTSITILDGLKNAHTSADALWNVAFNQPFRLPETAIRARIIYDNTFDSNGSAIHIMCRITSVDAL